MPLKIPPRIIPSKDTASHATFKPNVNTLSDTFSFNERITSRSKRRHDMKFTEKIKSLRKYIICSCVLTLGSSKMINFFSYIVTWKRLINKRRNFASIYTLLVRNMINYQKTSSKRKKRIVTFTQIIFAFLLS